MENKKLINVSRQPKRLKNAGFTLIEVIVTMAVIAILAAIAIPSLRGFADSSRVTSATNDLVSALNLARSEAVTRAVNVTVCKSANQTTCETTGNNWAQGWIVFIDTDAGGTVNGGDEILRVYDGPGGTITMSGNGTVDDRLTYGSTGFFTGGLFNGTITVAVAGGRSIDIVTSPNGRVRTE